MLNVRKYDVSPFYFLTQKRLTTESSPPDPPSDRSRVPVGTCVPTDTLCEQKKDQVEQEVVKDL
jgi:hypothetical protein